MAEGWGEAGCSASRARTHWGTRIPLTMLETLPGSPPSRHCRHLACGSCSSMGTSTHPHLPAPGPAPCVGPHGGVPSLWSVRRPEASLTPWDCEKAHKLSIQHWPREAARKLSAQRLALLGGEKHTSFRILSQEELRYVARCILKRGLEKPQNPISDRVNFSPQGKSVKTRGSDCCFKCKQHALNAKQTWDYKEHKNQGL